MTDLSAWLYEEGPDEATEPEACDRCGARPTAAVVARRYAVCADCEESHNQRFGVTR